MPSLPPVMGPSLFTGRALASHSVKFHINSRRTCSRLWCWWESAVHILISPAMSVSTHRPNSLPRSPWDSRKTSLA